MVRPVSRTLFLLLALHGAAARAQTDALDRANALFAGSAVLRIGPGQQLIIDRWDASGRCRQDAAPMQALDPEAIRFSPEDDAVVLRCRAGQERCIRSELFKLSSVKRASSCAMPRPPGDTGAQATVEALRALLAEQAALAAETSPPGMRMK